MNVLVQVFLAFVACASARSVATFDAINGADEKLLLADFYDVEERLNLWVVQIDGGDASADRVAREMDMVNLGPIRDLGNYYHFVRKDENEDPLVRKRDDDDADVEKSIGQQFFTRRDVQWFENQIRLPRSKRDFLEDAGDDGFYTARKSSKPQRNASKRQIYGHENAFNDPKYSEMWYIQKGARSGKRDLNFDLGIQKVWQSGITGKGVVVTVVDDGLQWDHPELFENYAAHASYDVQDFDDNPYPRNDYAGTNRHGTKCAGEIAMVANNSFCGVGIAYGANVGGIRLLDGEVTDSREAMALSFALPRVHIYSNSWGPFDDGKTLAKSGKLAAEAMSKGIKEGRSGLGVIYVFASGNGGANDDNCNCDGYVSSMYSFSISSASRNGTAPYFTERCASTLATTYSSTGKSDAKIIVSDINNQCADYHTGTSASAPFAAGVFALLLEYNKNLSWRDVKHIVAWTAMYSALDEKGWFMNGAGFWLNDAFGFGLLNGLRMVELANPATWKSVPAMSTCTIEVDFSSTPRNFSSKNPLIVDVSSDGCAGDSKSEVNYIEHVVLTVTLKYTRRGDVRITMKSPMKTEVAMLRSRKRDESVDGLIEWPLTSVQNWGETTRGDWIIKFHDESGGNNEGKLERLLVEFHGTRDMPDHYHRLGSRRPYSRDLEEGEI